MTSDRRVARALLGLVGAALVTGRAVAYDYRGRATVGVYQSKETFVEPSAGSTSNDQSRVLATGYLDLTRLGPYENQITIDVRDKYEQFGQIDTETPRLLPTNEPQLRQAAVKYPYGDGDLYWAVGRFPVVDASVLGNDGADLGYKIMPRVKLGLFGGLFPEQRDGKSLEVANEDKQAGAYAVYEEKGREWTRNVYAATAVVARQPTPDPDAEAVDPATATTPEQVEAIRGEPENELFWYTNVVYQPNESRRITTIAHVDLAPAVATRNLWASWQERLVPKLTARASVFHLDLNEYEKQRDLRDRLPGSTYTLAKLYGRYTLSPSYLVDTEVSQGTRGYDGATRTELSGRVAATKLANGALSAFVGGGYRKNFTSKDVILKGGATLYAKALEVSLVQQVIKESHDDGRSLQPMITDLSLGALIGSGLLAAASLEYEKDEEVTVVSALLTLGYRFTNTQATPVRGTAPPVERL